MKTIGHKGQPTLQLIYNSNVLQQVHMILRSEYALSL